VWVTLPGYVDTRPLLAEAVEFGVTFVPGTDFFPDGSGANHLRLAFCYEEPVQIVEGVRRIAEVLDDTLQLYRAFAVAGAIADASAAGEPVAARTERV
jgi:2-aminoadipate transaminase